MTIERQAQRAVALCMDIMNRYRESERTSLAKAAMVSDVQAIAAWVLHLALEPAQADTTILRPVEAALLARYGYELGPRLNGEFLEAYEVVGIRERMVALGCLPATTPQG